MNKPAIDIIGFPMDLGTSRRGVDMGPSALRIAGIEEKLKNLGYRVNDRGDVPIKMRESLQAGNPKLKYLEEIVRASKVLAGKVERSLTRKHLPLCIGGDHSLAIGSIAGAASYCRKNFATMGVIWIDAHTDMNDETTTPSGNIHGMPLAASIGRGNHLLTQLMGFAPKVDPKNCVMIGIRSIDSKEKDIIKKWELPVYTMTEIDKKGIDFIIGSVLHELKKNVGHIHVSFDIDSVDPSVAPGVGTPVAGGLTYRETHLIMESIAECGCMSSLDIAEVNPILDHKNQSAEFAAELVASIMGKRIL
ncbi:MAG: arginase [Desulfobacterales bacterium]|nr:arginase [Desulfobacterales bacterium]